MLFNLEPDHSVTGGAWYSDQDFETEFVVIPRKINEYNIMVKLTLIDVFC